METTLTAFEDLPDDVHAFAEMCDAGDIKHLWKPKDEESVREAKLMFEAMTAKGFRAFHLSKKGDAGEIMTEFDPAAKRVVFVPPMAGG